VSSLALVDAAGALVANFSMTDIKHLFRSGAALGFLYQTCAEFVADVRRVRDVAAHFETKMPVFVCSPSATLLRVVGQLCATQTHRVWVVDAHMRPVAAVTLADVIRVFAPSNALAKPAGELLAGETLGTGQPHTHVAGHPLAPPSARPIPADAPAPALPAPRPAHAPHQTHAPATDHADDAPATATAAPMPAPAPRTRRSARLPAAKKQRQ
jgi:CBS domain-containing protein